MDTPKYIPQMQPWVLMLWHQLTLRHILTLWHYDVTSRTRRGSGSFTMCLLPSVLTPAIFLLLLNCNSSAEAKCWPGSCCSLAHSFINWPGLVPYLPSTDTLFHCQHRSTNEVLRFSCQPCNVGTPLMAGTEGELAPPDSLLLLEDPRLFSLLILSCNIANRKLHNLLFYSCYISWQLGCIQHMWQRRSLRHTVNSCCVSMPYCCIRFSSPGVGCVWEKRGSGDAGCIEIG